MMCATSRVCGRLSGLGPFGEVRSTIPVIGHDQLERCSACISKGKVTNVTYLFAISQSSCHQTLIKIIQTRRVIRHCGCLPPFTSYYNEPKHERRNTRNQQIYIIVISKPLKVRDEGVGIPGDGSEDVFGDGGWCQSVL